MGASPDTRSPLPTAPPDTLLTHASYGVFWRTPARWSSDMSAPPSGSAEGGSAAWPEVDGPAEGPSPRMAQPKRQRRSSMGPARWRTVQPRGRRRCRASACSARDDRLLGGPQAQVLLVVVHLDDLPQAAREVLARDVSTLTALETVSGPGVLLDHVHAQGLERRVLRGGGLLGRAMRGCCVSRDGRCTPYSRAPPV